MVNRQRFGQLSLAGLTLAAISQCLVAQLPDPAAPHRTQVGRFFGVGVGAGYHSDLSAPRQLYPGLHRSCPHSGCQHNGYLHSGYLHSGYPTAIAQPLHGHLGFIPPPPPNAWAPPSGYSQPADSWVGIDGNAPPGGPPKRGFAEEHLPPQEALPGELQWGSPPAWGQAPPARAADEPEAPPPAREQLPAPRPGPPTIESEPAPDLAPKPKPAPAPTALPADDNDDELDLLSWRRQQQQHRQRLWQQWQAPESTWAGDPARIGQRGSGRLGEHPPRR
jgi:hypothetical protein